MELQPPEHFTGVFPVSDSAVIIHVNDTIRYQTIDGFGAAMTGTSAYVLHHYLDSGARRKLMEELFGSSGLHLTFIRQMIGASGYEIGDDYSYDDPPAGIMDTALRYFSILRDEADVIPMLRLAKHYNPGIKIFGSPCSAPAWMKTTGTMRGTHGGRLRPDCYKAYATYFLKYIDSFRAGGLPIYAVTIQNEPEYAPTTYPGMLMSPREQSEFIKHYLGPLLKQQHTDTKLIIFDHNWGGKGVLGYRYPLEVLSDTGVYPYVAGTGFHNYGGVPADQSLVHDRFPEKGIWFTEGSGGHWLGGFDSTLLKLSSGVLIGSLRNWAKGVSLWNLVLDSGNLIQRSKPPADQNYSECTAVVMIGKNGHVHRMAEYYVLAHVSSFVRKLAQRIESDNFDSDIETVAFRNPNGKVVLIALNNNRIDRSFVLEYRGRALKYRLPAGSLATFVWQGPKEP